MGRLRFLKNIFDKAIPTLGPRNEVDNLMKAALILQKLYCQQVLDPKWSWKRYSIAYLFQLALFTYVFFGALETVHTTTNQRLTAQACFAIIMVTMFLIKVLLFLNNRTTFCSLFVTSKTILVSAIKENGELSAVLKNSKRVVYFLFAVILTPVFSHEATAFWNYFNGRKIPMMPMISTLMPSMTPYHELAWLLHSIFLLEMATSIILDMWFVVLSYFLCAASDSLETVLKVSPKSEAETSKCYGNRLDDALRKFYRGHVQQTKFLNNLSKMYKWLAFVPLCNAALCTCIILLLLSKYWDWKFAPHVLPHLMEIVVYNWFGEQIKTKTHKMKAALTRFNWMGLSQRDRKKYLIMISFTNQEFAVKTVTGDLSFITMSAVLKASYQAFTVLQSMGQ